MDIKQYVKENLYREGISFKPEKHPEEINPSVSTGTGNYKSLGKVIAEIVHITDTEDDNLLLGPIRFHNVWRKSEGMFVPTFHDGSDGMSLNKAFKDERQAQKELEKSLEKLDKLMSSRGLLTLSRGRSSLIDTMEEDPEFEKEVNKIGFEL